MNLSGLNRIPGQTPGNSRESGLTLVELLIAMLIGLFLMAGVISVMVDSKNSFLTEQELSFIQENARFAQDELAYDIRMAGYAGCNQKATFANAINDSGGAENWMFNSPGVTGFESGDSDIPVEFASDVRSGTDVLIVTRAEASNGLRVTSHVPASAVIGFAGGERPETGSIMLIQSANCQHSAMFQVTGAVGSGSLDPDQIGHSSGGANSPGNCTKALSATPSGGTYDCSDVPAGEGMTFPNGSSLLSFRAHAYFIGESSVTGMPALFRESLVVSGGNADTQAQELVSGIEDMEILYGVDTTATSADGTVDRYYDADAIAQAVADSASGWVGWDRVNTVRMTLILRSARPVFAENTAVDLGGGFSYNDRFMRQRLSNTIQIRNRGLGG